MADITNPEVVLFSNTYLRPLAEKLRDLQLHITDAATEYTAQIDGLLTPFASGDVLIDGLAAQGAHVLTKSNINALISHLNSLLAELDAVGEAELRAKFTIRPPRL